MKILPVVLFTLLSMFASPTTQAADSETVLVHDKQFYTSLTQLLQEHVNKGQVNYKTLLTDKPALDRLVRQIGNYNLNGASAAGKKAFYINAYNTLVLHQVLEHYPLKSVMDVNGFFDKHKYRVAGEMLTLNDLEKKKLLLPYKDARLHFALVCAARSCPPLLNRAYTPDLVEKQLQAQAKQALQDPQFIRVQKQQKEVAISEIFKWYEDDFLAESPTILTYINRYRNKPLPKNYRITFYTYDWRLNDVTQ